MKYLVLIILSFPATLFFAQNEEDSILIENVNLRFNYGFNLGRNYSKLYSNDKVLPNGGTIKNGKGLKIGILMEYMLNKHLFISPKSELSFSNSRVDFPNTEDGLNQNYDVLPVSLDLSLHSIVKLGNNKWNPYLLVGVASKLPIGNYTEEDSAYSGNLNSASFDIGIGLEKLFKQFKVAPELRYSIGLNSLNDNPLLNDLYVNSISLIINFKS